MQRTDFQEPNLVSERVIKDGYCVGCGACAALKDAPFRMEFTPSGTYLPKVTNAQDTSRADSVCPFSDLAPNEDDHGERLYGDAPQYDRKIGKYRSIYVGAAITGGFREKGSSGGLTNWILSELLETGQVDGVVGVGEADGEGGPLFRYQIARTVDAVRSFSKSKYYPVEISHVIQEIRERPGRYAIVGVPCFAKAIRNLCLQDPVLAERVRFVIAIVCGHIKSAAFAESLAWQVGVKPNELRKFDFRVKYENEPANRYGVSATGLRDGKTVSGAAQVFDLYGTDWGLGFFKLQACDYCDDIAGETADVTLGDAWLPKQVKDWRGNNIVVVRNEVIDKLLRNADSDKHICLEAVNGEEFVRSQSANYRHRHDGLAYRASRMAATQKWCPKKRVPMREGLEGKRAAMMDYRVLLARMSHDMFAESKKRNNYGYFESRMRVTVFKYYYYSGALAKYLAKRFLVFVRSLSK